MQQCPKCGEICGSLPPRQQLTVKYQTFRGGFLTWDALFTEAAEYASTLGPDRLISISHSEDDNDGVVTVWFWTEPGGDA